MIAAFNTWFADRSLREKRLLIVMAALAALTLIWAGIILPVTDALSSARERHASAVIRVAETEARLDALKELQQNRPAPLAAPLDAIIRERANEAGFPLANVTVQAADRVQITIATAKPGALLGWITDLEAAGILVDSLNITNNGDQTVAADMTLKARGI
ncbi:type II secretion system protein M [Sphingomonas sp. So64.6b]|uniref:type II secretion system protein GspM n=1 Tax=Sphingomonas sp. So64.6b TaxID=2997354 RepID=UPI0016045DE2|nr:type II secretion system protein GspM [Sphingomonas sp. So64.6b]QNA84106.1 type II secretion system protein M [Sphingomonas sp. So64.6b]